MRQLFIIYILSILFISCQKKTQEPEFANKRYKDTFFKIKKLKFDWSKDISDIYEVYISNQNDTLLNQSKRFDKLVVDSTVSDFYDLKWYKTK
ncbi:hypothetical protein, partial [Aurantibacter sp.]|uniref:hypothetical protein n=1 Tax=Aurantibacter sp. TaxID=2807103 RepID=UPI0035C831D9